MAIYVDAAVWEWKGKRWCHLLADSIDELHLFANRLGLRREWFQQESRIPHYDLTEGMRAKALRMGAIESDRRTIVDKAISLHQQKSISQLSLFATDGVPDSSHLPRKR